MNPQRPKKPGPAPYRRFKSVDWGSGFLFAPPKEGLAADGQRGGEIAWARSIGDSIMDEESYKLLQTMASKIRELEKEIDTLTEINEDLSIELSLLAADTNAVSVTIH